VQQQAVAAFEAIDHLARRGRLFDRDGLVGLARRNERQRHQVGVAVEEDVLDEIARPGAVHVLGAEESVVLAALRLEPAGQVGRQVMPLHVEDELLALEATGGDFRVEGGLGRQNTPCSPPRRGCD
jgi:hypothetical protein